jgi:two-component system NtrC family sensor kinase
MHQPLHRKIFFRFLAIIALLGGLTLLLATIWFHRTLIKEAQERVRLDLQAAHRLLLARTEQDSAALGVLSLPCRDPSRESFGAAFRAVAGQDRFDFGGIYYPASGNGWRALSGRTIEGPSDWLAGLAGRPAGGGFALLAMDELAEENPGRTERLRQAVSGFPRRGRAFSREAVLVELAWAPVPATAGQPAGVLYGGRVLNVNNTVVDAIRDLVFQRETHNGKPLGTVTIFQGDVRIATNVIGPEGRRALGTAVSEAVFRRVFADGQVWTDRALVVDRWYISAYQPLRATDGRVIGMLYAGVLESRYLELRDRILASYVGIFLLGAVIAVILSFFFSRTLVMPLQRLLAGIRKVHDGNREIRMTPPTSASLETAALMTGFNEMVQSIRERDDSLTGANEQLRMINQRLAVLNRNYTEMLGFVTHELSNMLGVILLDAHTLKDELWDRLGPDEREVLGSILSYLEKFREMIRNFLDLSRIEKGKLVVEKVPINLYWEVLQPVGRELAGACQRGEMTLELDGTLEALEVEADPSLMRVVFYNLIHNGVKYGFANGRIRVFAEQAAGEWAVHVRNDGLGIPAEEIPNLFQRFYRVRMEGRQQREGSGLGLFISREIVERHGGQLEVRSEHGSWADFIVHIPA